MGAIDSICLIWSWGEASSLLDRRGVSRFRRRGGKHTHVGCNDKVQSILVASAGLNGPEIARLPFDTIGLPKAGLLSLVVLDLEFLIGRHLLVAPLEGRDDGMPQPLRFPLVLPVDGPDGWWGWGGVGGIKEEFSLARLKFKNANFGVRQPSVSPPRQRKAALTSRSLIHISPFQLPEISYRFSPVLSRLMNPPMAL